MRSGKMEYLTVPLMVGMLGGLGLYGEPVPGTTHQDAIYILDASIPVPAHRRDNEIRVTVQPMASGERPLAISLGRDRRHASYVANLLTETIARFKPGGSGHLLLLADCLPSNGWGAPTVPLDLESRLVMGYEAGARIFVNPWGTPANGEYLLCSAQVDSFVLRHRDALVIFPSGDEGLSKGVMAPGTARNALTVGVFAASRATYERKADSESACKPDLVVSPPRPGSFVRGSFRTGSGGDSFAWSASGACAVAGAYVTVLRAELIRRGLKEPSATGMKAALILGARGARWTPGTGWGHLRDIGAVIERLSTGRIRLFDGDEMAIREGDEWVFPLVGEPGDKVSCVLCWSEGVSIRGQGPADLGQVDLRLEASGEAHLAPHHTTARRGNVILARAALPDDGKLQVCVRASRVSDPRGNFAIALGSASPLECEERWRRRGPVSGPAVTRLGPGDSSAVATLGGGPSRVAYLTWWSKVGTNNHVALLDISLQGSRVPESSYPDIRRPAFLAQIKKGAEQERLTHQRADWLAGGETQRGWFGALTQNPTGTGPVGAPLAATEHWSELMATYDAENFRAAYEIVGRVAHLVADAASPAHMQVCPHGSGGDICWGFRIGNSPGPHHGLDLLDEMEGTMHGYSGLASPVAGGSSTLGASSANDFIRAMYWAVWPWVAGSGGLIYWVPDTADPDRFGTYGTTPFPKSVDLVPGSFEANMLEDIRTKIVKVVAGFLETASEELGPTAKDLSISGTNGTVVTPGGTASTISFTVRDNNHSNIKRLRLSADGPDGPVVIDDADVTWDKEGETLDDCEEAEMLPFSRAYSVTWDGDVTGGAQLEDGEHFLSLWLEDNNNVPKEIGSFRWKNGVSVLEFGICGFS